MICGFIGDVGSGKTASMINEAYYLHVTTGKKVISNLHLNFDHEYITLEDFLTMVDNKEGLQDCILLLDELHIWMDSRTSMSKRNRAVSYFGLQTRKVSVDLFYTTQYINQVDLRIRNLTNVLIECYTSKSKVNNENYTLNVIHVRRTNKTSTLKHIFKTSNVYNLYDTNEIIST